MADIAPSGASARSSRSKGQDIELRKPVVEDGPAVTALIAASPPLDTNSAYCNLLQCTDFADYCIVAERNHQVIGWVSGYRPPAKPQNFFVWQVAVAIAARGERLAGRMIEALLARPENAGVTFLTTTVTEENSASWALFEGLARKWQVPLQKSARFECDAHFAGAHSTEWEARIGPLSAGTSLQET